MGGLKGIFSGNQEKSVGSWVRPTPRVAGTDAEKNMFAHPTCVWWQGFSISMRYFLHCIDKIRTHRDRNRYRDRDRIQLIGEPANSNTKPQVIVGVLSLTQPSDLPLWYS
jgi:hypothetical protein